MPIGMDADGQQPEQVAILLEIADRRSDVQAEALRR